MPAVVPHRAISMMVQDTTRKPGIVCVKRQASAQAICQRRSHDREPLAGSMRLLPLLPHLLTSELARSSRHTHP